MSKKEFRPPVGRLQQVMCEPEYAKFKQNKLEDLFNPKITKNNVFYREEDSLKAGLSAPWINVDIPKLLRGKEEKKYKKEDVFEVESTKKCPKGKKVCDCDNKRSKQSKKKIPARHKRKPIKKFKDEFNNYY